MIDSPDISARKESSKWKEVDENLPWVAFDFEETLGIVLEGEPDKSKERVDYFTSQGLTAWSANDLTVMTVLRPGALDLLQDLGKDFNVVMLTTMSTELATSLVETNPDFRSRFCFVAGRGGEINNNYYEPNTNRRIMDTYAAKHPDRLRSNNPKVLVDDSEMYGEMWQGKGQAFVNVLRATPPLQNDDELKSLAEKIRSAVDSMQTD